MDKLPNIKKLPLIIGVLLIIVWSASKKTIFQLDHTLCIEHTAKPLPSYLDRLDKLTCLTNASWEQFYRTARPILPEVISEEELKFVYHFFQAPSPAYLEKTATQADKLKVLLIFSSIVNPE